jgi:hypothetical protein
MKNIDRRGFLKTGIAGAAGVMAFSPSLTSAAKSDQQKDIILRTLGKTGMKIPVISFGVMRAVIFLKATPETHFILPLK